MQAVIEQDQHTGQETRQQRLERLRAEYETVTIGSGQWHELHDEIRSLEDTFVFYQGREIDVELVNYMDGAIATQTGNIDGLEKLFRDANGCYYLRRTWDGVNPNEDDHQAMSGRTYLHRLSTVAAVLWATTRANCETLDLRQDALDLLSCAPLAHNGKPANVGEIVCTVDGPVSGATGEGWFDGCIQPEEGSGARVRTIFDLDPLHAGLLKLFTDRHGFNVAVFVRACLTYQLEAMYNDNDREEEPAAVRCLRRDGRLSGYTTGLEVGHMKAVLAAAGQRVRPCVESEVAA